MKREILLPCWQEPTIGPYPELLTCFPKIHSNIILPRTPSSSEWSLRFWFSDQNSVCISRLSLRFTWPAHLILLDMITLMIFLNLRLIEVLWFICLMQTLHLIRYDGSTESSEDIYPTMKRRYTYKYKWY